MPRYKFLIIMMLVILLFFILIRSFHLTFYLKQLTFNRDEIETLPPWLTRSHRKSGPYAFDYIPLAFEDLQIDHNNAEPEADPPSGGAYVNPGGSPYPPGTLADMIWQQKQRDQRYAD